MGELCPSRITRPRQADSAVPGRAAHHLSGVMSEPGRLPYAPTMTDIVLGVLAILAGALLCFGGQFVLRLIFPIWGAFAGFAFGAGLVASFADERFLGTALGWVLGLVFALIFAILAYFFYAVAVVLVMASIGFTIGSGLVVALGIDWNWVAVLIGVVVGALLGIGAVVADVPMLILVLASAVAGAIAVVTGLMLIGGSLNSANFTDGNFTSRVNDDWWWYVLFVVVAGAGIAVQSLNRAMLNRSVRASWTTAEV
jgi:hypothetical protein